MWGFLEKALYGYSADDLQAESDKADAQLSQINDAAYQRGAIDQGTYDQTSANISAGHIDAEQALNDSFKEGLSEGVDNVRGTIGTAISSPFKLIPWQLWGIGAIALFVYMGGWIWLRGIIARKAK